MKKIGVSICVFLVILITIFLISTRNAYVRKIFLSENQVFSNRYDKHYKKLYEFKDENFYVCFGDDEAILSARKDFLFWVENNWDYFPPDDETNTINSTEINNILYIYGVTKKNDVNEIALIEGNLNRVKNYEYFGKRISSKNVLCFCLKIPRKKCVTLSASLAFMDSNNRMVSETNQDNKEILNLLSQLSKENINPTMQTINENILRTSQHHKTYNISEKYYIIRDDNKYIFKENQEKIDIQFFNDFALLIMRLHITQRSNSKTNHSEYFSKTYKLEYSDTIWELKEHVLNGNN